MNSPHPFPRGAALIEAMAALVVFSVGILGVMQMNVVASEQNNVAQAQTVASKLARDVADSFERLPFDHVLLNKPCGLDPDEEAFSDIDEEDGRVTLQEAMAMAAERPMLGAASAIFTSDATFKDPGTGAYVPAYEVAWRARRIANPQRHGQEDQIRIVVMVRYRGPVGGERVVKAWAVKYDVAALTGDPNTTVEL